MKIRVLLLSMFVLFLSVKPLIELCSQTEPDACCVAKAENEQKDETACDNLCSPFQPCCPYYTFTPALLGMVLPKSFHKPESPLPIYKTSFNTAYLADFWQPPKLV